MNHLRGMWTDVFEAVVATLPPIRQRVQSAIEGYGLEALPAHWLPQFTLLPGHVASPARIQQTLVRFTYANPAVIARDLQTLAAEDYIEAVADGYQRTDAGETVAQAIWQARNVPLSVLKADVNTLRDLQAHMAQIADGQTHDPHLDDRSGYQACVRRFPRGDDDSFLRFLYTAELLDYYRDDVHVATWRRHGLQGTWMEALNRMWRGEAHTPQALHARMGPTRGYDLSDYQAQYESLVARGWMQVDGDGRYHLTADGTHLCQQIEDETDHVFYAAWERALAPHDIAHLQQIIQRLAA